MTKAIRTGGNASELSIGKIIYRALESDWQTREWNHSSRGVMIIICLLLLLEFVSGSSVVNTYAILPDSNRPENRISTEEALQNKRTALWINPRSSFLGWTAPQWNNDEETNEYYSSVFAMSASNDVN